MPEFITIPMKQCADLSKSHVTVNGYSVTKLQGDWVHCTCKGFRFRGSCKHLQMADDLICTFHEETDGTPNGDACPQCGGALETVYVAV